MFWSQKVIDIANAIEGHIREGRTEEALEALENLRKVTGIDPLPPPLPPPPPPGPYFGTGPLPDEDW